MIRAFLDVASIGGFLTLVAGLATRHLARIDNRDQT